MAKDITPGEVFLDAFSKYRSDIDADRDSQKLLIKNLNYTLKELIGFSKQQGIYSKELEATFRTMIEAEKNTIRQGGVVSRDADNALIARIVTEEVAKAVVGRKSSIDPTNTSNLFSDMKKVLETNQQLLLDLIGALAVFKTVGDRIASQFKDGDTDDAATANFKAKGRALGSAVSAVAGSKGTKEIITNLWGVGKAFMGFLVSMPFLSKLGSTIGDAVGRFTGKAFADIGKLIILSILGKIRGDVGKGTAGVRALQFLASATPVGGLLNSGKTFVDIAKGAKEAGRLLTPITSRIADTRGGQLISNVSSKIAGGVSKLTGSSIVQKSMPALSKAGKAAKFIGKGAGPLALLAAGATYADNKRAGDSTAKALTKTILSHAAGMATYAGITGAATATTGVGGIAVQGAAIGAGALAQSQTNKWVDSIWNAIEKKGIKSIAASAGKKALSTGALGPTGMLLGKILDNMEGKDLREEKKTGIHEKFFDWIRDMWPWSRENKEAREAEKEDKLGGKTGATVAPEAGSDKELEKYLTTSASGIKEGSLFDGHRVTSEFGERIHPVYGTKKFHKGIDLAYKANEAVAAKLGGKITKMEYQKGYGNVVYIKDDKTGIEQRIAHLNGFAPGMKVGQQIKIGDIIGAAGNTGVGTGVHVHYETRKNGVAVDPVKTIAEERARQGITAESMKAEKYKEASVDEKVKAGIYSSSVNQGAQVTQNDQDYAGNQNFCNYVSYNGIHAQMAQYANYNCGREG